MELENGRLLELNWLSGAVARFDDELGVPTSQLDGLLFQVTSRSDRRWQIRVRKELPHSLDEFFLPGEIENESPKGNVHIYFSIVTALVLSVLFTVIVGFTGKAPSG